MSQESGDVEGPSEPSPNNHHHLPADQHSSVSQPSSQEDQWHTEQKSFWERQIRISRSLNRITAIAAGIALVALIPLYLQMRDSQSTAQTAIDQLQMTKTSLQTTERAWVTVKGITLKNAMVAGQEPLAVAGFYNSGHSPALQMTIHHWHKIVTSLAPKDKPDFRRIPGESLAVMGPDSKMWSEERYLGVAMEEMSNMGAGRAQLYSYGIIQYRDIFDIEHWTIFCYRTRNLSDLNLVACSEWNEVDKN